MAMTEARETQPLDEIVQEVARGVARAGIKEGKKGTLTVTRSADINRQVLVYWTPFQISVPGESVTLLLDVPEPRRHWAEAYLSPNNRNWVLFFFEREDGDPQLAYYRDYATPAEAVEGFFGHAEWHTLTPSDTTWEDVSVDVAPEFDWDQGRETLLPTSVAPGVQESLKKSTIVWLRWDDDGVERTMPVWYLYDQKEGKIFVLSGERQQTLPGAENMRRCDVIFRQKGKNVRVADIPASVRVLPHGDEWDERAEKIAEKRLNIPGLPEDTARRWRDECVILELTLRS